MCGLVLVVDIISPSSWLFAIVSNFCSLNYVCFSKGDVAWRLYDTYGFPVDLTTIMAEEKGKKINMVEYEAAKKHAQVRNSLQCVL